MHFSILTPASELQSSTRTRRHALQQTARISPVLRLDLMRLTPLRARHRRWTFEPSTRRLTELYANPAFCRMTGLSVEELLARAARFELPGVYTPLDHLCLILDNLHSFARDEQTQYYTWQVRTPDGARGEHGGRGGRRRVARAPAIGPERARARADATPPALVAVGFNATRAGNNATRFP